MEEDNDKGNPYEQIILVVPVLGWDVFSCSHYMVVKLITLAYSALEIESRGDLRESGEGVLENRPTSLSTPFCF